MGKIKIDEDMAAEWNRRHQKGQSYRSIAFEYGVDPRTVQGWVQKLMQGKDEEHWEDISRQLDSKYLDKHHRLLLRAAMALLGAVHTDPLQPLHVEVEYLIHKGIESVSHRAIEILKEIGINFEPQGGDVLGPARDRDEMVTRLSQKLVDALMEHEPLIEKAVDRWKICWSRFQQAHLGLAEEAKSLFKKRNLPDGIAEKLKWAVVKETLGKELSGEIWNSRIVVHDGGEAELVRYCPDIERRLCKGPQAEMKAAQESYDELLPQVSHRERITPLLSAYRDLQGAVRDVDDLVDRMVLTGRPQGRCTLCPNYSPGQSARSRARRD